MVAISITGLTSQAALRLIDATRDNQISSLQNEPQHQREQAAFLERITNITTPEEFVEDYEVYSFVMKAFDMEDQMFGRGMIRKILESDPLDTGSLVNTLEDSRFGELHGALGFTNGEGETVIPDFSDPEWQQGIVDRYYNTIYNNDYEEQNGTIGTVLEIRDKVEELETWYDVLGDEDITEFFFTALGMPEELSALDLDKQVEMLEAKYDLSKIQEPAELESMLQKYMLISDIQNPPQAASSAAIDLLTNSVSGQYSIITVDIPTVSFSASSIYR